MVCMCRTVPLSMYMGQEGYKFGKDPPLKMKYYCGRYFMKCCDYFLPDIPHQGRKSAATD